MKKTILLFISILFFTSGCYDYTELNDMAIVSGISIDYQENTFQVAFEILNTANKEENPDAEKVYLVKGSGSSLAEAFSDASLEIAKIPYLAHLKTIIMNEEVARNHVEEMIDFLLRDNHIRNIFYLTIAKDTSAFEVLQNTDVNNPVVSNAIAELIDSSLFSNNIAVDLNYEKFVTNIIDPRKDTYVSSIEIENGILKLGPIAIFKNYEMQAFLNEKESATFKVMTGDSKEIHFKIACPNDEENFIILSTFNKPKSGIEIENTNVKISSEVEVNVIENHCKMNFKEAYTYTSIQDKVKEKLKQDMQSVMEKSIKYDSDILKIKQIYYQKYKKDIDFKKLNYTYDTKAIINRNGLIFEVEQ